MNKFSKASEQTSFRRNNINMEPANDSQNTLPPLTRKEAPTALPVENSGSLDAINDVADAVNDSNYGEKIDGLSEISASHKDTSDNLLDVNVNQENTLNEISASTAEISAKLSVLSDKLREKYNSTVSASEVPIENADTTSEVLAGKLRDDKPSDDKTLPQLIQVDPKPSNSLLNNSEESKVEGAPSTGKFGLLLDGINSLKGAVVGGFKKSIGITDKISSMLLKYSVTQAVQAAKLAAAVFAIILGLDLLRIAWQVWGEKIMAKFEEWSKVFSDWWDGFKEWSSYFKDMKYSFEGMQGDLMGIRNAWESGNWPALAAAIGTAFLDGIKTLSGMIDRVITKLISTLLDKLGFSKAAKAVEAEGLQRYQNMGNNRLDPENQRKLAEEQLRREKNDGLTPTQRGVTSFLPDTWRKNLGLISDDEYGQIQAEKKDQAARKGLSHEDQVKNVAATNEAREAIARYRNIAENVNPNNKSDLEKADKYKKEAQQYINSPGVALTPSVKAELQAQLNSISSKSNIKSKVQPAQSAEAKETQLVKSIKTSEANKAKASQTQPTGTANVQTNIVKTNKSYNIQNPITSTRAPGVFKATGVN
ncbi:hypothetical protein ACX818_001252 [Acinetobacter baumannii]